jgi:hypothetical protein
VQSSLDEGESVHFVTTGSAVSFWESYFLGWVVQYLNRRALVFTDRRIILLQVDWRDRAKELRSQLRYGAIGRVKGSLLGGTKVQLRDGKARTFTGVPKADRKFMAEWIDGLKRRIGDESAARSVEDLCPHCSAVVRRRSSPCDSCGGTFKSAKRAGLLSLLLPGLGDLYIGHRKLAVLEMLVASAIWLGVLWPNSEYPYTASGYAIVATFVVMFVHVPDAIATWYIARMGVYPGKHSIAGRLPERAEAR